MSRPVRKRRLTLARELHNSVKAGPRVWLIVSAAFLCLVLLPLLSKLASLLAMVLVGAGLVLIAPVIVGVVVRGLVGRFREAVVFRVLTNAAATAPVTKQTGDTLPGPATLNRGKVRRANVIEVETVGEERKSAVLGQ